MKKIFLLLLTFMLILNICSCYPVSKNPLETIGENSKTGDQHGFRPYKFGTVGGDYIFARNSNRIPIKYNIHDGKSSYICPDPFCSHDYEECPFMGVEFASIGNIIYFAKQDEITGKGTLYSFDVDATEIKTVYSDNGYLSVLFSYEYKLLLHCTLSNDYNATSYYFWYDTQTSVTEEVEFKSVPKNYSIYDIKDDRIIWRLMTVGYEEYYSTDLNGKDFKEYDYCQKYGNYYIIETEYDEYGIDSYSLYVIYNGETEKKPLLKGVGPCLYYENKIVYFKNIPPSEQKIVHTCEDGTVDKDKFGGDVYVINPDGTGNHLLFHTDECIIGMTADRRHPQVSGDYFGILVAEYEGDGIKEDKLIIANINTGEFVVTHD